MARVAAMRDEDIDTSDIPELGAGWFARATYRPPQGGYQLEMPVDGPTWAFFMRQGECGLQEAAAALRAHAVQHQKSTGEPPPG